MIEMIIGPAKPWRTRVLNIMLSRPMIASRTADRSDTACGAPQPSRTHGRRALRSRLAIAACTAVVSVAGFQQSASAIYIRDDKSFSTYATLLNKPAFTPIGFFTTSDWGTAYGSGTLVAPNKVLTAAHLVDVDGNLQLDDPTEMSRMVFGVSKNVPSAPTPNVSSIVINPAYRGANSAFDLAIITLKTPIYDVTPALMTSQKTVGKRAAMVGYGYQGTGTRDSLSSSSDKLAAFNMISTSSNGTLLTDFDSPRTASKSTWAPSGPLVYEGTTAPGDSGSPLLADFGYDKWRIAGVLHGGYNDKGYDSWYGDVSVYASLANQKNIDFIVGQGLSYNGNYAMVDSPGTSSTSATRSIAIPEPSTLTLLLPAMGLLAARRRAR